MYIVKNFPYEDPKEFDTIEEAIECVWHELSKEERQALRDTYDAFDSDNPEHYFFEEWLADYWKDVLSEYIDYIEETDDRFVMGIPSYAICYLIYGESDDLTCEDIENINRWVEKMQEQRNGRYFDISPVSGREEYFEPVPPFGLPCSVVDCWVFYY